MTNESTGTPAGDTATTDPTDPAGPAGPYGAPSPTWTPAPPAPPNPPGPPASRPAFRDRVVKLWHALAVGAAALVVGVGGGAIIGHAVSGSDSDGFRQRPDFGSGQRPGQGPGQGFDQGRGGQDLDGQTPDGWSSRSGSGSGTPG